MEEEWMEFPQTEILGHPANPWPSGWCVNKWEEKGQEAWPLERVSAGRDFLCFVANVAASTGSAHKQDNCMCVCTHRRQALQTLGDLSSNPHSFPSYVLWLRNSHFLSITWRKGQPGRVRWNEPSRSHVIHFCERFISSVADFLIQSTPHSTFPQPDRVVWWPLMKDRQVNPCVQGSRARDTKGRILHHCPNPNLV